MGSGEADRLRVVRGELDAWARCPTPGCHVDVPIENRICPAHGGPGGPMRRSDIWGATTYSFSSGDAEPERDPAA